jgi:hypothetical protein
MGQMMHDCHHDKGSLRVDWPRMICELGRGSTKLVALTVGHHPTWVDRVKNRGAEPRYLEARKLVLLWMQETGKTEDQLPLRRKES